eukprot:scaffold2033_cov367-Prasinococcus_capsulatus_cf.AAC.21
MLGPGPLLRCPWLVPPEGEQSSSPTTSLLWPMAYAPHRTAQEQSLPNPMNCLVFLDAVMACEWRRPSVGASDVCLGPTTTAAARAHKYYT